MTYSSGHRINYQYHPENHDRLLEEIREGLNKSGKKKRAAIKLLRHAATTIYWFLFARQPCDLEARQAYLTKIGAPNYQPNILDLLIMNRIQNGE